MKPSIDHVILTRFNLPSKGAESLIRAKEGWLRDRQQLFEKFCLPSVRKQTSDRFRWIVYFDPKSPQWLKERISQLSADGTFIPIFREEVPAELLLEDIRSTGSGSSDLLLTTNLDNDDGLSLDFVARIQDAVDSGKEAALYVTNGLIQRGTSLYLRRDAINAFCSVSSPWPNPRTCWLDWHNLLPNHMGTVEIPGAPGWLQIIHKSNVSNRVRGTRVDPSGYRSNFSDGLAEIDVPNRLVVSIEQFVLQPLRALREGIRMMAKQVILRLGGRKLLDQVKAIGSKRTMTGR